MARNGLGREEEKPTLVLIRVKRNQAIREGLRTESGNIAQLNVRGKRFKIVCSVQHGNRGSKSQETQIQLIKCTLIMVIVTEFNLD